MLLMYIHLSLSVSELFYCPICAGSGESAASVAGGALASAVAALSELERLPLSFKATRRILANLVSKPNEMKYRRLRLENKSVRELIDLEPVLNILTSVGFTKKLCERTLTIGSVENETNTKEEVLILDGTVPVSQIKDLLEVFDGISKDTDTIQTENDRSKYDDNIHTSEKVTGECGKTKRNEDTKDINNKESRESNN